MTSQPTPSSAELFLRSLAPTGTALEQTQTIQRVEDLAAENQLESSRVTVTGRGVVHEDCYLSTAVGKTLVERLDAIERWTKHNEATVPGITTKTVDPSPVHQQPYTVTTVPNVLLLEYEGASLQFVSPATVEGEHVSVSDHLDAISEETSRNPIGAEVRGVTVSYREATPDQHEPAEPSDSPIMVPLDAEDTY